MNIFILGLPKSGRTTLANELVKNNKFIYLDASYKTQFNITSSSNEEYHQFILNSLKEDSSFIFSKIQDILEVCNKDQFIIDDLINPQDFIKLFNPTKDTAIFLNRLDSGSEYKDFQNIAVSVMRDYCYWLASIGLLSKQRWLEFNFKIPGEPSEQVKILGNKNSVYLVKNFNKVISITRNLFN